MRAFEFSRQTFFLTTVMHRSFVEPRERRAPTALPAPAPHTPASMEEKNALQETDTLRPASATDEAAAAPPAADRRERREMLLMRAGEFRIALFADEVESISEALPPTPLPHAPRSVPGVVILRGRIRTLIDPRALLADETTNQPDIGDADNPAARSPIDGDADDNRDVADDSRDDGGHATHAHADDDADNVPDAAHNVPAASLSSLMVALRGDEQLALAVQCIESRIEISPADIEPRTPPVSHIRGTLRRNRATIIVLHPSHLFEAAMQGTDRRRQRS